MSERPAALEKAESLYSYALSQGAPIKAFQLALSPEEGLELLDYWCGHYATETYLADVAEAHVTGDPFGVLAHFVLHGLQIVRRGELH